MPESIGKRIASLRQENGWTQQSLADRLAMSRVAISHIEMDLTIPSERSIILMAGVFKLSPLELVDSTTYPRAKAERLPSITTIYTQLETSLMLMLNDIDWLGRFTDPYLIRAQAQRLLNKWGEQVDHWRAMVDGEHEMIILSQLQSALKILVSKAR